jgi:AmmeMemoRadiSam system protein A
VCDHSCEIQLPFLRWAAPEAQLTALYVGHMDASERREAAGKLAAEWRPGTVFLASSDFTHYGRSFEYMPFPPDFVVEARLRELDFACIEAASSMDSALFLDTIDARNANVCGTGPIALLLDVLAALGGDTIYQSVLDYQTSGEIGGDFRHSVSYAALAYHPRQALELAEADRNSLLDSAAFTLRRLRGTGTRKAAVAAGSSALSVRRGAFVSLHQGKELLGCVGNHTGQRPLREEIGELTLSAALDDPRFSPAAAQEGPIDIELSILTPMRRKRRTDGFQLGRHGAMIRLGTRLGLLLPQVAPERGWSAVEFWRSLARKGQMDPMAWCDPRARLDLFEAQIFSRRGAA